MFLRLSALAVFTGLSFSSATTIDLRREELMTALQWSVVVVNGS